MKTWLRWCPGLRSAVPKAIGTVLIVNPGTDVYGSDLQMLESVEALVKQGLDVTVLVPAEGPLVRMAEARGATVEKMAFPVLRRTDQSPARMLALLAQVLIALPRLVRYVQLLGADAIYVNTVTIPWWLMAGRLLRIRTVCHVHEAEAHDRLHARLALYTPLTLSHANIMISRAAMEAAIGAAPWIERRSAIIPNGVPDRPDRPQPPRRDEPLKVGVVARMSPRKGTMDALEAVSELRREGRSVELHLFGTAFDGYEWYERLLRARADEPDLAGAVHFRGYVRPVWPAFDDMDIILAPSHVEPFGNSVVEAQYSLRPVIASQALGHQESITTGESGLLVPINDPTAMAKELRRLIEDEELAATIARRARVLAVARNSVETYAAMVGHVVASGKQLAEPVNRRKAHRPRSARSS